MQFLGISALAFNRLIEMTICCQSSQKIIDATENLCQQIEWKMVMSPVSQDQLQSVKVILNMKKNIRYTALNLFGIKSATILTLVSYVGSYAVILIQTT